MLLFGFNVLLFGAIWICLAKGGTLRVGTSASWLALPDAAAAKPPKFGNSLARTIR